LRLANLPGALPAARVFAAKTGPAGVDENGAGGWLRIEVRLPPAETVPWWRRFRRKR
jgi:hypothetical protein